MSHLNLGRLEAAHIKLCKLVATGYTTSGRVFPLVEEILKCSNSLVSRYPTINVVKLLQENCNPRLDGVGTIIVAMGILEKYGKNLLRSDPPPQWRVVRLSNAIFHNKVDNVKGTRDILLLLGYTESICDGLAFPDYVISPDKNQVISVTVDVILLKYELALLQNGKHPRPQDYSQCLRSRSFSHSPNLQLNPTSSWKTEKHVSRYVDKSEVASTSYSTSHVSPVAFLTDIWQPSPSGSTNDLVPTFSGSNDTGMAYSPSPGYTGDLLTPTVATSSKTALTNGRPGLDDMCLVCGQKQAEFYCETCKKKQCEGCDKIWHQNPNRVSHQRVRICQVLVPVPVVSPAIPVVAQQPTSKGTYQAIIDKPLPFSHTISSLRMPTSITASVKKPNETQIHDWEIWIPQQIKELKNINDSTVRQLSVQEFCHEIEEAILKYKDGVKSLAPSSSISNYLFSKSEFLQDKKKEVENIFEDDLKNLSAFGKCENTNEVNSSLIPETIQTELASVPQKIIPSLISPVQGNLSVLTLQKISNDLPMSSTPPTNISQYESVQILHPPIVTCETNLPPSSEPLVKISPALTGPLVAMPSTEPLMEVSFPPNIVSVASMLSSADYISMAALREQGPTLKTIKNPDNSDNAKDFPIIQSQEMENLIQVDGAVERNSLTSTGGASIVQFSQSDSSLVATLLPNKEVQSSTVSEIMLTETPQSTSSIRTPDFSILSPEKIRFYIEQEDVLLKTMTLIDKMRTAEDLKYSPRHVQIALQALATTNDSQTTPTEWLELNWENAVKSLRSSTGLHISMSEASQVLLLSNGDPSMASETLRKEREAKMRLIALPNFCSDSDLEKSLFESNGDCDAALTRLQAPLLEDFRKKLEEGPLDESITVKDFFAIRDDRAHLQDALVVMLDIEDDFVSTMMCELIRSYELADILKDYEVEDVLEAAKSFPDNYDRAVRYLRNKCMICFEYFPKNKVECMTTCGDNGCMYCKECLAQHLHVRINEGHVRDCVCPVCKLPDIDGDEETVTNYFAYLDVVVRSFLSKEDEELFQKKLRDHTLRKMPNFRWCSHCPNGNEYDENILKMVCSSCNKATCYKCKRPWEDQHEGVTCQKFLEWKQLNDSNFQAAGLAAHLKEYGIDCPECKFRYAIAKGGCMHFKCIMCSFQFCSGCSSPFKQGKVCNVLKDCVKKGLHAHHPRDCLFYLRDFEIECLQKILSEAGVRFGTQSKNHHNFCQVNEQKETSTGLVDDVCGRQVHVDNADLCALHYKEYLVNLINENKLDPATVFTIKELETCLTRSEKKFPPCSEHITDEEYRDALLQTVQSLPLIHER